MAFRNVKQELQNERPPPPSPWPFIWRMIGSLALAAALLCAALWVWPGFLLDKPWPRPGPPAKKLTLFFSSDVSGYLEPCDCTEQRWGGIAKAAGLLTTVQKPQASLAFDVGQMTGGNRLWEQLAWAKYLQALAWMEYAAANLGAGEITLSASEILKAASASSLPLISANVVDRQTGRPLLATHHQVLTGNLRVTAVGVVQLDPHDALGEGLAVTDPNKALGDLLPSLRPHTDVLVLLAACDENTIEQLAKAHPEIDVILGGRVSQASKEIRQVGRCKIAYQANKGQMLGRVDLQITSDARPAQATSRMILLDNAVPEAPPMLELVEQYNAELARLNRRGGLTELGLIITPAPAGSNRYLGSAACQTCHPQAYQVWKRSDHGNAYASLVRKSRDSNPDCLRCHVLSLGSGDGFTGLTITPDLIDVHCESCHGRAGDHLRARTAHRSPEVGRMPQVVRESCESCHDCIHSPYFDYDSYWEKIKHGKQ